MTQINRSSLLNNAAGDLLISQARENFPVQLSNSVAPVFEIGAKYSTILKASVTTVTGAATIYTTPRDKDFFLTGFTFSFRKDAACDIASGGSLAFVVYQDGAANAVWKQAVVTLTAQDANIVMTFPFPMKLDRNSVIQATGTFAAGVLVRSVSIVGFILE